MTRETDAADKFWRVEKAQRVAFVVDTAAYFSALYQAFQRAKRSIFIIGWELDAATRLFHDDEALELPVELAPLLGALIEREAALDVRVLPWDYRPMRLTEHVLAPLARWEWPHHQRFVFHPDGNHANGASHHQKIVVVDDALAFCGGMDLTTRRWDTSEHLAHDPRRRDQEGEVYGPWHDVQLAVDGDAAAAMGEIARERWRRATGESPPNLSGTAATDVWPESLDVDLRNAPVGISRTEAEFGPHPHVGEIERVYLDAIAAARDYVYIENQYLTAYSIGEALCARLQERDGPEIVLVVPEKAERWLEEGLMSALRVRLLNRLEQADRFNRFRVYCPVVPNLDQDHVDVHSKVLIADGKVVSVGSANISNRSMKLDTECNLSIEAGRSRRRAQGIRGFLYRLLAEHLDCSTEDVATSLDESGSLIETIDGLSRPDRNLTPLSKEYPEWIQRVAPSSSFSDPEGPMTVNKLTEALIPRRFDDLTNHPLIKLSAGLAAASVIALWWLLRRGASG